MNDAAYTQPAPAGPGVGWLRRTAPFLAQHRGKALGAFALSIAAQGLTALLPLLQQRIIDDGIIEKNQSLGPLIMVFIMVGALAALSNYARRYVGGKLTVEVQHDIRRAIHRRLYELDFAAHDRLSVGDVMSRAAGDLTLLSQFFFSAPMMVGQATLLLVSLIVMITLSPLLSLVVIVFIPIFAFFALRFRDRVFPASWNDQRVAGHVAGVVDEAVSGVRVVKAFAQEDRELERLTDRAHELYQSRMRTARINARYSATLQALPLLGQVGVLAVGGWLTFEGRITIGVFLAFSSYLIQIITPVRLLSSMLATTQQARAGSERLYELFDMQPRVIEADDAIAVPEHARGTIDIEELSFGFPAVEDSLAGPAVPVDGSTDDRTMPTKPLQLRDISLRIQAGERVGIVGASGSGKTVLAYLLARFYEPDTGRIRLDGQEISAYTLESLRSEISVVFEESFLFSTTIRENIAFGRPDATDEEIEAAARIAQAHEFIMEMPNGYDSMVGERGLTLSGGQRQRIALARAALIDPTVLILDDATSAIDAETEERIFAGLGMHIGQRTTILIAHRSSTLRLADRVIVLDQGQIVAEGTNAELWANSALYRELLTGPESDTASEKNTALNRGTAFNDGRAVNDGAAITKVDSRAWPYPDPSSTSEQDADAPTIDMAQLMVGLTGGGGGRGGGMGARAAFVAATPELLARVAALPPLRGNPDIDIAEATAAPSPDAGDRDRSLARLLRRFRWALMAVAVFVIIDALTSLAGPLLIRHGLDAGVAQGAKDVLWWTVLTFLIVQLLSWANQIIEMILVSRTGERMLYTLRLRTFAHLQRLSLDYYDRELGGRIMTRMTTDVEALAQLLQQGLLVAMSALVSCAGIVVVLLALDWRLALAVFAVLPVLAVTTVWFQRQSSRSYLRARDAISAVNAELQESIAGVRVTQSLGRTDNNADRFARKSQQFRDARLRSMQLMSFYFASTQMLSSVAIAITLGYGSYLINRDALSSGLLIAFLLYLQQFFAPLQQLSAVFDQWVQAGISLDRLDQLLATPSSTPLPDDPITLREWSGEIVLDDVRFRYSPTAPDALRGVTLTVAPGETVALVGTTGAGKSTFVKLVARFYDPTGGRVLIDGIDIRRLDLRSYRQRLGYVPQEPFLFAGTIRSNIAYGRPDASDLEIERAARAVGAHHLVAAMPEGYLTSVTETGRSLSAGQRQLLCLARAALVDPTILILDEATSNLDLAGEAEVQQAMARAASGRTTLLIAHRLQTARQADRIVVIEQGQIVESGSHEELLAADGRYATLWATFDAASSPVHTSSS